MAPTTLATLADLIERLDRDVQGEGSDQITASIKATLERIIQAGSLELPEQFYTSRADGYARRLVHHCTKLGYTITAMTWGPGQGTPVHDHDGMWCVEGVVAGQIDVVSYELLEQQGERYRFEPKQPVRAGIGSAGALIPPFDHHTISNPTDSPSITLHIYSGIMERCCIFEPVETGAEGDTWYQRVERHLVFDED